MADFISMLAAAGGSQGEATDQYFQNTTLLLHGDGTNGAQNNTFLDSGTANSGSGFTITRNGNTTQGSFSPFSVADGEWSNYFAGSQRISAPANAAFQMGLGDFTIEAWVFVNSTVGDQVVVDTRASNGNFTDCFAFTIDDGELTAYTNGITNLTGSVPTNEWVHVALTRQSGTLKGWINGTQTGATADWSAVNINNAGCQATIGSVTGGTAASLVGNISNVRVVKGRAVYTSAFTPPTAPLGATSGGDDPPQGTETSILTCQSNRFVDNSSNAFAITVNSTPSVQPFSPFAATVAYDTAVNGGSAYFDGSDYLSVADDAAFNLGTNDWTMEGWFYATAYSALYPRLFGQSTEGGGGNNSVGLYFNTNSDGSAVNLRWGTTSNQTNDSGYITINATVGQWHHIAVVRDGSTMRLYFNGVQKYSTSVSGVTFYNSTADFRIGASSDASPTEFWQGYISNVRLLNGTCAYTGGTTFTPPTAPFTNVTNTALLTNFTNAGIFDNTGKNVLETVGNAQINTTTKKYGTGSMEFDGSGDYVIAPSSYNFAFGTGDYTVEFWLYGQALTNQRAIIDINAATWQIYNSTSKEIIFYNGADRITSSAINNDVWYHIAITRSGGTTKLFIDGQQEGSSYTDNTDYSGPYKFAIADNTNGGLSEFDGFIDDLRITKGIARYTANFTPPGAAFPNIGE